MPTYGGNGFDFGLDPYRHGGMRGSVTSVPYPVVAFSELQSLNLESGVVKQTNVVVEEMNLSASVLTGTLRDILKQYTNNEPEELASSVVGVLSGSLDQVLVVYQHPDIEELASQVSGVTGGSMKAILIVFSVNEGANDALASSVTGVTGGSLS